MGFHSLASKPPLTMCSRPRQMLFFSLVLILVFSTVFATYAFDHDTGEDCAEFLQDCTKDDEQFFECPIACAKHLEPVPVEQRSSAGALDDEEFYALQADTIHGQTIRFENLEGYVTVIASLPLLPGVAQFYYEMLEHLNEVYPYTLEILVVPYKPKETPKKDVRIKPHDNAKVLLLENGRHVVQMLNGKLQTPLVENDKATLYLVSADGNSVEAFVSTTFPDFQRYIRYHFVQDLGNPDKQSWY